MKAKAKEREYIKNFWGDRFHFYCGNHNNKDGTPNYLKFIEPMSVQELMYYCPKHFEMDDEHPEGYSFDEKQCYNKISQRNIEKIVSHLSKVVLESINSGAEISFRNYKFNIKERNGLGELIVKIIEQDEKNQFFIAVEKNKPKEKS